MNLVTKKLSFVLIIAAVALAGCSKKPKRPDPAQTVLGPDASIGSTGIPLDGNGGLTDPNSLLGVRDGVNAGNVDREALKTSTVYFDFDKSGIKTSERPKLAAAKAYLEANPTARLLLEGHCDWKGTAEYNLGLGDRRANAAKEYLVSLGVSADKLEVLSKGDLDAVENADEATQAKDRRVDVGVLHQ